jgi:hypothetical protein
VPSKEAWSRLKRFRGLRASDYDGATLLIAQAKANRHRHIYLTDEGKVAFDECTASLKRDDFDLQS